MPAHFEIFTGQRLADGRRRVINADGVSIMASSLNAFDWGPKARSVERRVLAAGLLYHCGIEAPDPQSETADAFATVVVAKFDYWGWSILPDQILAWLADYRSRRGKRA